MDKKKKTEIKKYEVVSLPTPSKISFRDGKPSIKIANGDILDETKTSQEAIISLLKKGYLKEVS